MVTERIGFIGLGHMGAPMAANIARAGARLTVFDLDSAVTRRQAEATGASAAADLAALGRQSDIVVTMLPTGGIVRQVMLDGPSPLIDALAPGSLVIDMSSSEPEGSRSLHEALSGRGIRFVDAPVSGAVPRATNGTLAIMVGAADDADFGRAEPVLRMMGDRIFRTGDVGTGHAMKALNNYVAAAGFAAASEALILGERFGLDPAVALDIMNVSTGRNFSTEATIKTEVLTRAFKSGFGLALLAKDVRIAADLASNLGARLPLVAETDAWWQHALHELDGRKDHTEAFAVWRGEVMGQ
ncbi:NAD(P)-dependent oxidoreductase [Plastorhodobacter daqingensis]|uniref:NAD(P)-dependent oxidoreductase n=1 Tax=Plastorhodobacter daqingensis TaxID=1387281 RepID=A0ABW2UK96_9RHOB